MRDKFAQIEKELNQIFVERQEVIRGLLVGLISGHHVLLLGPPGTAKSAIVEEVCQRVQGRYFRWLLARTSTPEELFGPVSLKALENDSYKRITTGKLPEANIAFLDEIFKSNSAVLNSLLTVLNERLFFNNGSPVQVPLELCVGASNELPEDREELGALWDRFLLRYTVSYIRDVRSFESMLSGNRNASNTKTMLDLNMVHIARMESTQIDITQIIPNIIQIRDSLYQQGIIISDRRWKQCLDIIKANAWLEGHTIATEDDLTILTAALWVDPEQILTVKTTVLNMTNPAMREAQDLMDEGIEIYQNALKDQSANMGIEAIAKFKRISKRLEELVKVCQASGKNDTKIKDMLLTVSSWNKEVAEKCLNL